MKTLNNIWDNYTYEFSPVQKAVVAVVLGLIFLIAMMAVVMLTMEVVASA